MWCSFPQRENPAVPGPGHVAYTLAVSGVTTASGSQEFSTLVAYTTSRPWTSPTCPLGVFLFDAQAAASLGQARAFVMDLRRLAAVPVTVDWFPRLDHRPGGGVLGHMAKSQQRQYLQVAETLLTRRSEIAERLGPLWPGGRR